MRVPPLTLPYQTVVGLTANQILFGSSAGAITQSTTLAMDSTGVNVLVGGATNVASTALNVLATKTVASAAGAVWDGVAVPTSTLTLSGVTAVTTAAGVNLLAITAPALSGSMAVTRANTMYIAGPPTISGGGSITTAGALSIGTGILTVGLGAWEAPVATAAGLQVFAAGNANLLVRNSTNHVEAALTVTSSIGFLSTQTNHAFSFGANNTVRVTIPALGGCVIGTAAIATNATDGFLYIPTCAGNATGTPVTQTGTVAMVYDTTNNKLLIFNAAWKGATAPGAWS